MTAAQESFYIQQFKLGDSCSFQILYEHYYKRILCYGKYLFPHSDDDLKDAYQDIFITMWKARQRITVDKTLDFYLNEAEKYYISALNLDPKHRGALEYYGELLLLKNDLAGAEKLLARLDKACTFGCEEFQDLKKSIQQYKAKKP